MEKSPPALQEFRAKTTRPIKLKDKIGRNYVRIGFMDNFGFIPEEIVIEKVRGQNKFTVIVPLTPEEIKKEDDLIAKYEKKEKELKKLEKGGDNGVQRRIQPSATATK